MRLSVWIATISLAATGILAQIPGTTDSAAITQQLDELARTPTGVEEKRLQVELQDLYKREQKEREELYAKLRAVQESSEGKELARKRTELIARRNEVWESERKALAESARRLYQQRHAELQALAAGPLAQAPQLGLEVLNYPRVDGSTSTHPLSIVVACRLLGVPYAWTYPEPQGSPWGAGPVITPQESEAYLPGTDLSWIAARNREAEFTLAAARLLAKPAAREQDRLARIINTYLATSASTHNAYLRLINGGCDLNLTVRGPSEDEQTAAKAKGVEIELTPVGRDALIFMVSRNNATPSLTQEQLRSIYNGEMRRWRQAGGKDTDIHPLWRERNSGSRELFDAAIGAKAPEQEHTRTGPDGTQRFMALPYGRGLYTMGMSGPYNQLLHDGWAIGYSLWYYDRYMAMSAETRLMPIDGVEPTRETIASGRYPLVTKVYAACRKGEPEDSSARKLIRWLLSPEGQKVVQESGYVPLQR